MEHVSSKIMSVIRRESIFFVYIKEPENSVTGSLSFRQLIRQTAS